MGARLGIVGVGNMGGAVLRGAIREGVLAPAEILVCEADEGRRSAAAGLGCPVTDDPGGVLECGQIMLAVKPHGFPAVADRLGVLEHERVVVSVMAGLSSAAIRRRLGERARVVRAMPNTPCQIGRGATGLALGEGAAPGDEQLARALFDAIGVTVTVDEPLMHAVTALSGGGPAYVFLLAEMMIAGAREIDVDEPTARTLVTQTILGAAHLLAESGEAPAALREAVTSPGGTTAEALRVMFDASWPAETARALAAARDRGVELDET